MKYNITANGNTLFTVATKEQVNQLIEASDGMLDYVEIPEISCISVPFKIVVDGEFCHRDCFFFTNNRFKDAGDMDCNLFRTGTECVTNVGYKRCKECLKLEEDQGK